MRAIYILLLGGSMLGVAADSYYVGNLAGSSNLVTSRDGAALSAVFRGPRQAVMDAQGNIYVADSSNHTIRKITGGVVSTLAGQAGIKGYADGAGSQALFNEPSGVLVAADGSVIVLDTNNGCLRKIASDGVVSSLAGCGGLRSGDGTGKAAGFNEPRGFAQDSAGNLYVADYNNQTIRKVTPTGVVTTLAGSLGQQGSTDGTGAAARFSDPQTVTVDSAGNVYVGDTGPTKGIRKISPTGVVTTLYAGAGGRLSEPRGLAVLADGSLLVSDVMSHEVFKLSSTGSASAFVGAQRSPGIADGTGTAAGFNGPMGLSVTSAGNVLVADSSNHLIRQITAEGVVSTVAGTAGFSPSVEGERNEVRFADPFSVAVDEAGNAYLADPTDHAIRKVTPQGISSVLAGKPGSFGFSNGSGSNARFRSPSGIAVSASGVVYVADTGNHAIRKITADGVVTTLAGSGQGGGTNATGTSASFNSPYGLAVDRSDTVYVADFANNMIRKISSAGVVTTLAGSQGPGGFTDNTGTAARLNGPIDVALDTSGNVYVVDRNNHAIRKITSAGVVTTLAGSGSQGSTNATGRAASFKFPTGIAVDGSGNVLVADTDNQVIRQITSAGVVSNLVGSTLGSSNGVGSAARFNNPKDVAVDSSGRLLIADRDNRQLRQARRLSVSNVATDCLLDWGEASYGSVLTPAALSQSLSSYYFRQYGGGVYVGVSSQDQQVYFLQGGTLTALGALSSFLTQAACVSQ